jgi:putative transposase
MLRSHKIRLVPNAGQAEYFARACGTARFAWNWALEQWNKQYEAHLADPSLPKPSEGALRRQLNAVKREQYPWMMEVTKCAPQEAIIALGVAFKNWFDSLSGKRKGPRMARPDFKKKGKCRDSFHIHGNVVAVDGCRIRIPLLGWVRMREPLRFAGSIKTCCVSRVAGAWHVSVTVETSDAPARTENQGAVGVDLGLTDLAVTSSGVKEPGPKALAVLLARLRRLSRAHSRKVKGSANRKKSAARLARLHWRIANVRGDALHKLSDRLTRDHTWIAVEDLGVKGMMGNRHLARHIADAGWGELRRQLVYKASQRGVHLAVVDRFFPSSKTCSDCGHVHEGMTLADRVWACPACGEVHDRDVNAAKNILKRSIDDAAGMDNEPTAGGGPVAACGEDGSGLGRTTKTKPASQKQEAIHKLAVAPVNG